MQDKEIRDPAYAILASRKIPPPREINYTTVLQHITQ